MGARSNAARSANVRARERAPEGRANVFMGTITPQEVTHGQRLPSHLSALSQHRLHRGHQRAAPRHAHAIPTLSTPYPRDNGGYPRVSGASCPPRETVSDSPPGGPAPRHRRHLVRAVAAPYPRWLLTSQVSSASRSLAAVAFPPVIGRITVRPA